MKLSNQLLTAAIPLLSDKKKLDNLKEFCLEHKDKKATPEPPVCFAPVSHDVPLAPEILDLSDWPEKLP